jgi:hypothetical protein
MQWNTWESWQPADNSGWSSIMWPMTPAGKGGIGRGQSSAHPGHWNQAGGMGRGQSYAHPGQWNQAGEEWQGQPYAPPAQWNQERKERRSQASAPSSRPSDLFLVERGTDQDQAQPPMSTTTSRRIVKTQDEPFKPFKHRENTPVPEESQDWSSPG